ncbi:unnamed protein product [Diamesa serratosioi]
MPYADRKYSLNVYNPPANEINFMGGLGTKKGNVRSKVHTNRPTANQMLLKMRTSNRILVSFCEDPASSNSLSKQHGPLKKFIPKCKSIDVIKKNLQKKISDIQMADNVSCQMKSPEPSSLADEETEKCANGNSLVDIESFDKPKRCSEGNSITKKGTTTTTIITTGIIQTTTTSTPIADDSSNDISFRKWALAEREKRNQVLQQVSFQQSKQIREQNEIFPKIKTTTTAAAAAARTFDGDKKCNTKKENTFQNGNQLLSGYLYGGFGKLPEPDNTMKNQTKFGVPLTMFGRAEMETKVHTIQSKKLNTVRLEYMKIPQIPSDSSDSENIVEDIKTLSLIRTPYFCIPTISTHKVKRAERLKSKYLKGNRLKRINMLLYDRKVCADKNKEKYLVADNNDDNDDDDDDYLNPPEVHFENDTCSDDKSRKFLDVSKERKSTSPRTPYRQSYHEFLHNKFLEKLQVYNEKLNQKLISFEEFREHELTTSATPASVAMTLMTSSMDKKSFRDNDVMSMVTVSATPDIQNDPAFKAVKQKVKKNFRFGRSDNRTGPFYVDPFLIEKIHNPEKGVKIVKNYNSLMRGHANLRKRLQVNGPSFDEEQCGGEKSTQKYYHRLATEWDSCYINEIRYRPTVKKFCVKTDIIKIREMVRKKFFLYFMQENLVNLFAKQEIENQMINKTNRLVSLCEPQFKHLQDESFQKTKEKLEMVKAVTNRTIELRLRLAGLKDQLEMMMQTLMYSERKWENIMMMQNYYYMLMMPLWRLEHDWIHCNKDGELDFLKKTVIYCKKIHIRSKCVSEITLHAIKKFFETSIEPVRLEQMRKVTPDVVLLRNSLEGIKSNVLGILNKQSEIMLNHAEIVFQQQQFEKMVPNVCSVYQKNMNIIDEKVKFIIKRREYLVQEVESVSNAPLTKCIKNAFMRKISAICNHLCKSLFPDTFEIDESVKKYTITENFIFICNHAMHLLNQLDTLPSEILDVAELESRNYRKNKLRVAKASMKEQNLFSREKDKLENHFKPTKLPKKKVTKGKMKMKMRIVSMFSIATNKSLHQ